MIVAVIVCSKISGHKSIFVTINQSLPARALNRTRDNEEEPEDLGEMRSVQVV